MFFYFSFCFVAKDTEKEKVGSPENRTFLRVCSVSALLSFCNCLFRFSCFLCFFFSFLKFLVFLFLCPCFLSFLLYLFLFFLFVGTHKTRQTGTKNVFVSKTMLWHKI